MTKLLKEYWAVTGLVGLVVYTVYAAIYGTAAINALFTDHPRVTIA